MCGICGELNFKKDHRIDLELLKQKILIMQHRGPEEFGIFIDGNVGLGHARLSIIDLEGGLQPIHNEDKSIWIVYNGEIYNYLELKELLLKQGHHFYTKTDTEVIIHLYEEKGVDFINDLNGQFAFAIWDCNRRQLILARDRVGIRPLFYANVNNVLLFASEIKSILLDNRIKARMDPYGLDQLFTFWANIPPRTTFKDISELPPAHYLVVKNGNLVTKRYWDLTFPQHEEVGISDNDESCYAQQLLDLIKDSIRLRLRADVPVASYLSGGLDSSFITALVKKHFNNRLQSFSVAFADRDYDESSFQLEMSGFLGTRHKQIACTYRDIGEIIPQVVWYAEKPLIRTAPAPLYLLSKLVRDSGIKVVLTGEGADEVLAGYDLFREMKIRRFWARYPNSKFRSMLLSRLYHYRPDWPRSAPAILEAFYRTHLSKAHLSYYSHIPRWNTTANIKSFFSNQIRNEIKDYSCIDELEKTLPRDFLAWDYLSQAQYIEIVTLLSGNLLSSQGDRMMMAHSVESRLPFLDHRVVEFSSSIPASMKLRVLKEKYILKKIARPYLPPSIYQRSKQAYRAPDSASFFAESTQDYVLELLSEENISKTGYFDPVVVENLVKKCRFAKSTLLSTRYNMAIVAILTTLLVDKIFIKNFSDTQFKYSDKKEGIKIFTRK